MILNDVREEDSMHEPLWEGGARSVEADRSTALRWSSSVCRMIVDDRGNLRDLGRSFREGDVHVLFQNDADETGQPDDLITSGTLRYDAEEGWWVAEVDWDRVVTLPNSQAMSFLPTPRTRAVRSPRGSIRRPAAQIGTRHRESRINRSDTARWGAVKRKEPVRGTLVRIRGSDRVE